VTFEGIVGTDSVTDAFIDRSPNVSGDRAETESWEVGRTTGVS